MLALAADRSQAYQIVGRRLVEFRLWVCCILLVLQVGPGARGRGGGLEMGFPVVSHRGVLRSLSSSDPSANPAGE